MSITSPNRSTLCSDCVIQWIWKDTKHTEGLWCWAFTWQVQFLQWGRLALLCFQVYVVIPVKQHHAGNGTTTSANCSGHYQVRLKVKSQAKNLPGLCDSSHPLITVFGILWAQLQSLLVVVIECDSEIILKNKITARDWLVAGGPTEGKQQDSSPQVCVEHKWVSRRASYSAGPAKFIIKPVCIGAETFQLTSEPLNWPCFASFGRVLQHTPLNPQPFLPPH